MCFVTNQAAAAPYQQAFANAVPNSPLNRSPGLATLGGLLLQKQGGTGFSGGSSTAAVQTAKQARAPGG